MRKTLLASAILALAASGSAMAAGLSPGQYDLGGIQQICLVSDGTWYGTTYNWNGHWVNSPGGEDKAAIHGNYVFNGSYYGLANDTITVERQVADWYDWFDDGSTVNVDWKEPFTKVKRRCDKPFLALNLHRAVTR